MDDVVLTGLGKLTSKRSPRSRTSSFVTKAGVVRKSIGRQVGERPSDKHTTKVLELHADGLSYRLIGRNLGLSKSTVMAIVQRAAGA